MIGLGNTMKIGVITYHRARNFGSALQAYALNRYLNENGWDAEVIDYHSSAQDQLYTLFEPVHSLTSLARNIQSLAEYRALITQKHRFDKFIKDRIVLSSEEFNERSNMSILNEKYSHFICGSDQIWNPNCADFTNAYLLDFVINKKACISYAASIGIEKLPVGFEESLVKRIKDFAGISVREQSTAEYLSHRIGRNVSCVPDPVLLLSESEWKSIIPERIVKKPYIFCYFIGDVAGMRTFAANMRKKTGYELVVVYKNLRDLFYRNKKLYSAGPEQFLSLLLNSEYVCTNSFHAVMFSLIFQKNFWVFTDLKEGSAKSRIESILNLLGLSNRILNTHTPPPQNIFNNVNFSNVLPALNQLSITGKQFLQINLKGE